MMDIELDTAAHLERKELGAMSTQQKPDPRPLLKAVAQETRLSVSLQQVVCGPRRPFWTVFMGRIYSPPRPGLHQDVVRDRLTLEEAMEFLRGFRLGFQLGARNVYPGPDAIRQFGGDDFEPITEKEVIEFAEHIVKSKGYHQGIMIAWGFTPGARNAAQQLAAQHAVAIDFVKIQLVPIESNEFKEHITSKHPEYKNLLKFILPPQVRISTKRISDLEYEFDVSESVSLNPQGICSQTGPLRLIS